MFGGQRKDWEKWSRVVKLWRLTHDDVEDQDLGGLLVESLTDDALDSVLGSLADEDLRSFEAVFAILKETCGQAELLEKVEASDDLAACVRSGQKLADFLAKYKTVRLRALRSGRVESKETDGVDLLRACELGQSVTASILQQLTSKGADPSFGNVKELLDALAQSYALTDSKDKTKKKKSFQVAQVSQSQPKGVWSKGQGGKGGKGAKGEGKGKGGKGKANKWQQAGTGGVCWHFTQGKCTYGDKCSFSHEGKGASEEKKKEVQRDIDGKPICFGGVKCPGKDKCRFSHKPAVKQVKQE